MERVFLDELKRSVRGRRKRDAIIRELESHLEAVSADLESAGYAPPEARREGLHRLGDPVQIAAQFQDVYRPSRKSQLGVAFAVAGALVLGTLSLGGSLASATTTHHTHPAVTHRHHLVRHTGR